MSEKNQKKISINDLAWHLHNVNVERNLDHCVNMLSEVFRKINWLVLKEQREVYIRGLGTFFPKINDKSGVMQWGMLKDKPLDERRSDKSVTLGFRREKSDATKRDLN